MEKTTLCFYCGSSKVIKFGKTYYKKDRCKCKKCERQFVVKRTYLGLSKGQKMLIEKLLFERISLLGICRVLDIEEHQLYTYLDELYEDVPNDLYAEIPINSCEISLKCLEIEADEAWSFVGYRANKVWIWVAMHRASRQIIGLHIGNRIGPPMRCRFCSKTLGKYPRKN